MKLTIEIDMDNAAFEDNGQDVEVRAILSQLTRQFGRLDDGQITLRDTNGNKVGFAVIQD